MLYVLPFPRCRKNTNPGEDTITSQILPQLLHLSMFVLLKLLNGVLASVMLPVSCEKYILVPILNPKKPAHEGNLYRPIAP